MSPRTLLRHSTSLLLVTALAVIIGFSQACSGSRIKEPRPVRIGLAYIGPHELINQIVEGFKSGVADSMGATPYEIVEKHANGDKSQVPAAVAAAISSQLNVLATITTPVSQVALKNAPAGLPIVFVGVTDPVGAGLVKSMDQPELSTGVSDLAPIVKLLSTIRQLAPAVKKIGFPYSPDEQPAVFSRQLLERAAPGLGFIVDARPVTSRDELSSVVRALTRVNDAIMVGADNAMFEAAPTIATIALENHTPFFAADSSSVKAGAVAGVTIDYRNVGVEGGRLAVRIAKGEKAGSIPVTLMTEGVLELNRRSITLMRLPMTDAIFRSAKVVY